MRRELIESLEPRLLWAASLVRDITPGAGSTSFQNVVAIGSTLYFSADDGSHGRELWVSNGTPGSTSVVDVNFGSAGSNPSIVQEANGALWFNAFNGSAWVLHRLDGFTPHPTDARDGSSITGFDGKVYFAGSHKDKSNTYGIELMRMNPDGTNVELVKDIWPGNFSSNPAYMVKTSTGYLFFAADSPSDGRELFVTTGVPEPVSANDETEPINVEPGGTGSNPLPGASSPKRFVEAGGFIYAYVTTQAQGRELYYIRTIPGGAKGVLDCNPGPASSDPDGIIAVGEHIFFTAITANGKRTLCIAGPDSDEQLSQLGVTYGPAAVGNTVFFVCGQDLYKTDGTPGGTQLVKASVAYGQPVVMGGFVYFRGSDSHGYQLWRSDGTSAGTVRVTDLEPSSFPENLTNAGGTLYFSARSSAFGTELWKYTPDDVVAPPAVTSIAVNDGAAQRSQVKKLTVVFDRPADLLTGAFKLGRLNTGGSGANNGSPPTDASGVLGAPSTTDGGKTWVLTFTGTGPFMEANNGIASGSLVDGIYTLTVDPSKVMSNGVPMATAASLTFHRLFGDANGSKNVNTADFGLFRNAFGKGTGQAGFDAAFDFDNNGTVNTLDFGQFRGRSGKSFTY